MSLGVKGDAVFIHSSDVLELKCSLNQLVYLFFALFPENPFVSDVGVVQWNASSMLCGSLSLIVTLGLSIEDKVASGVRSCSL
jgi:hypothetical protein